MNDSDYPIDTIRNLRDCRHYATVLCARRVLRARRIRSRQDWGGRLPTWDDLSEAAASIYNHADPAIYPALDTIKRVMEIDETVDNPGAVLMHAGIAMKAKEAEQTP
jgi:hypothetical protein